METGKNNKPDKPRKSFGEQLKSAFTLWHILALIVGGVAGYLYSHFIGCPSGACSLRSNPLYYILLWALLGYLLVELFKKKKKE